MDKMRVLIIDEDILVRRAIARVLNDVPNVEIRASEKLGNIEELVQEGNPDLVLLNIEQAAESGFETFHAIRVCFPKLPVVVISSRSFEGAQAAFYALRKGAIDVITKPVSNTTLLFSRQHLKKRVPPIIEGISRIGSRDSVDSWLVEKTNKQETESVKNRSRFDQPIQLVVIGGSMGAPKALKRMLKNLPSDFPVPVVIAQHFPRYYTSVLTKELAGSTDLTIHEATEEADLALKPGHVWVASGGTHCEIQQNINRSSLRVHRGPRQNSVRPSIDVLFRSAARLYGSGVLGVLLSGKDTDGLAGARAINDNNGHIIVQDPGNAVIDELPLSVIRSGYASEYYPVELIGDQIKRYISQSNKKAQRTRSYHFNLYKRKSEYFRSV